MTPPRGKGKVVLPGGAGLVGQNLVPRLKARGYTDIVVLDKRAHNVRILRELHPDVTAEVIDLAEPGPWQHHFADAAVVVMLQAQIGAKELEAFTRNTVDSTRRVLEAIRDYKVPYLVHVSSSVLDSLAEDDYVQSKREQEEMVLASGVPNVVLRPTLMFGWFDRKHLGWLSRFMRRVPVFPIPGDGRYLRQPLYVGDFCDIIVTCVEQRHHQGIYRITGLEKIDYVDIIRTIKQTIRSNTVIVHIPYWLFAVLLRMWSVFDKDPPFTVAQLRALATPDVFDVIDWPDIFSVAPTPFAKAIRETFTDPTYSKIELEF